MALSFRRLTGSQIADVLAHVAQLRIAVFREWPYLYDGDAAYERTYLGRFAASPGAVVVTAEDDGRIVGAATAVPLADHFEDFAAAFEGTDLPVAQIFYLAESVLLPAYRGQGAGVRFFAEREAAGRESGHALASFCAVVRPEDHPARPAGYVPLDAFWRKRGYRRLPGVTSRFSWRDIGDGHDSEKPMQFWLKTLRAAPAREETS